MRFMSIDHVREGMILGKPLLAKNGDLLLKEGCTLVDLYIHKIKALGYSGIYIEDSLSGEIEVPQIIDDRLRFEAIKEVRDIFASIEQGKSHPIKLSESFDEIINNIVENILENKDAIVNIIDLKQYDNYTFYHSVNVCILSLVIGTALKLNKKQLYYLGISAILHDIGKTYIPKEILNKNGKLSDNEFEIIKTHSFKGYNYVKDNLDIPSITHIGILHHHERYEGNGYPTGIKGSKISLFGRIISLTDVYDAITSDRPYRKALPPHEGIEYIMANGGMAFDPKLVSIFSRKIAPYPVGTCVRLSNDCTGLVVENYPDCCTRPKIKIITSEDREIVPYYIDLKNSEYLDVVIKEII